MLKKLDHIGIAVNDLEKAAEKYEAITGKTTAAKEVVKAQKVSTSFFPVGEIRLELLKATDPESPIAKFIENRGEGVHHLCFEVEDLSAARKKMSELGLQFIDGISEQGAGGTRVAFIHPKSTSGVLIELIEYPQVNAVSQE